MSAQRKRPHERGHEYFLEQAVREARKAEEKGEVPVGAVVVLDGAVIARGHNLRETRQSILGHAELAALAKASRRVGSWRLVGCDVYVTLEPCPMCAGALQQARVRHVYYGVRDPKAGVVSLGLNVHDNSRLNHRYSMTCLEAGHCGEILSEFFKKKRRKSK